MNHRHQLWLNVRLCLIVYLKPDAAEIETTVGGPNLDFWRLADNPLAATFVRFWTMADIEHSLLSDLNL